MKSLFFVVVLFNFGCSIVLAQNHDMETYQNKEPRKIMMNSHDPNLKSFPEKSFYQSRKDWQHIIDSTWGVGLPLAQKQQVFNTYTSNLDAHFDGFQSLGMNSTSWDTLKNYYYSQINDSTSRGRFAAIMSYLCSKLRDGHTWCYDNVVFNTPLNPGVPFLMFTGQVDTKHFGAVTTVLPDSSVSILRVADNHPLNLEPGDIILGYEGVPWKDLITELMEAELPNYDFYAGYYTTFMDNLLIGAGMNWHLFDTIDILKYATGDTVHLSVAPLINFNPPSVLNNEQMEIPNIPFPNYFNGEIATSGIISNTNIGYIYVFSEWPTALAEQQFYQAVASLQNTDALIIDMRWNEGGWAEWQDAFKILSKDSIYTLQSVQRCNPSNFDLCPINDQEDFMIEGSGYTQYDKPIAVLLGPNCFSDGDINAYRLRYLNNVRTFGKPTWASLGENEFVNIAGWGASFSNRDRFHINNPGNYLNRKEFPIDFPVWHNRDDVAQGKDAVVEAALNWIYNSTDIRNNNNDTNIPLDYTLLQNYPNPFNPITKIKYSVPKYSQVVVKVFDVLGKEIETLVNEEKPAGTYELTWNATNLPSGVYFYQLRAGSFIETKKMLLLK